MDPAAQLHGNLFCFICNISLVRASRTMARIRARVALWHGCRDADRRYLLLQELGLITMPHSPPGSPAARCFRSQLRLYLRLSATPVDFVPCLLHAEFPSSGCFPGARLTYC